MAHPNEISGVEVMNAKLMVGFMIGSWALPTFAQQNGAAFVYEKVSSSIVVVETRSMNGQPATIGSGVVIALGKAVTNCHVLQNAVSVRLRQGQVSVNAEVVQASIENDLCVIAFSGLTARPAVVATNEPVRIGQKVFAIGAPAGLELTISEGIVSSVRSVGPYSAIQTSAAMSKGSSGGGLFDEYGSLVGITTFSLTGGQNLNFAIPVAAIPTAKQSLTSIDKPSKKARDITRTKNEPNWQSAESVYQSIYFTSFQTNSASWSEEGGFGLRWGMGPGDVRKVYPALKFVFRDGSDNLQLGTFDQSVQDRNTTVFVRFFRGRLYEVALYMRTGVQGYAEIVKSPQESWGWRERMRQIIEDAYGTPACAPTEMTRVNDCDRSGGFCNRAITDIRDKLLRWIWRTDETEVIVGGGGTPSIMYRDLLLMSGADQARELARADFVREEEKKVALERERISGRPSSASATTRVDPSPIDLNLPPPPIACFREEEPTSDGSTLTSSWSAVGFEPFYWGMGPGDVKKILIQRKSVVKWLPGSRFGNDTLHTEGGITFYDNTVPGSFRFKDGRLISIELLLSCDERNSPRAECSRRRSNVLAALDKQWGKGRCVPRANRDEQCRWDTPDKVWLTATLVKDIGFSEFIFDDPELRPKRVRISKNLSSVPAKEWATDGWNQFRWGMGFDDVSRKLAESGGAFKTVDELICYQTNGATSVNCTLEPSFHKFSVFGITPEFRFEFFSGKLRSIELSFSEKIERSQYWNMAEKLRDMLVERYGQADEKDIHSVPFNSMTMRWRNKVFAGAVGAYDIGNFPSITVTYDDPSTSKQSGTVKNGAGL